MHASFFIFFALFLRAASCSYYVTSATRFVQSSVEGYYQENKFIKEFDEELFKKAEKLEVHLNRTIRDYHQDEEWRTVRFQCYPDRFEAEDFIECFVSVNFNKVQYSTKFCRYFVVNKALRGPRDYDVRKLEDFIRKHANIPNIMPPCIEELTQRYPNLFTQNFDEIPGLFGLWRLWAEMTPAGLPQNYLLAMAIDYPEVFLALFGYPGKHVHDVPLPASCKEILPTFHPRISKIPVDKEIIKNAALVFRSLGITLDPVSREITSVTAAHLPKNCGIAGIAAIQFNEHAIPDYFQETIAEALEDMSAQKYPVFYDMTMPAPIFTGSPLALPTQLAIESPLWKSTIKAGSYWISIAPYSDANGLSISSYLSSWIWSSNSQSVAGKTFEQFGVYVKDNLSVLKLQIMQKDSGTGFFMTICWKVSE